MVKKYQFKLQPFHAKPSISIRKSIINEKGSNTLAKLEIADHEKLFRVQQTMCLNVVGCRGVKVRLHVRKS